MDTVVFSLVRGYQLLLLLYSRGPFDSSAVVAPLFLPKPYSLSLLLKAFPCIFSLPGWGARLTEGGGLAFTGKRVPRGEVRTILRLARSGLTGKEGDGRSTAESNPLLRRQRARAHSCRCRSNLRLVHFMV